MRNQRSGITPGGNLVFAVRGEAMIDPSSTSTGWASANYNLCFPLSNSMFYFQNILIERNRYLQALDAGGINYFIDVTDLNIIWPKKWHTFLIGFSDYYLEPDINMLPGDFEKKMMSTIPVISHGCITHSFKMPVNLDMAFNKSTVFLNLYHYSYVVESEDMTAFVNTMLTQTGIAGLTSIANSGIREDWNINIIMGNPR
jgi:hypothetical protein